MFGKERAVCQSCSMPMDLDANDGGTEADGSHSSQYCSMCYQDGHFVQPEMKVEEMQNLVIRVLHDEKHLPKFMARSAAKKIPKLERWQH